MSSPLGKTVSYIREAFYTIYSIVKGHIVTFVNLFRKKVTLQYPEVRAQLPEGYRGIPALPVDSKTGKDLCIGCGACVRACPTQLISVETSMGEDKKRVVESFTMKAGLCMFCGLCAEVCPVNAIVMTDIYELAVFSKEDLLFDRRKLNELGGVRESVAEEEGPVLASTDGGTP